ncbi:hypothetical protein BOTBODRAFT_29029 [Botryobasidium botryosum FD-172 SS1]|uniref:Uncharacterized protein n=1 Tax=Botryobasidium botryosum (strain FD-172 SS1) TaxID=930990 RepID=A0A067MSQ6_BOTB1|nr:hypothetical protein BOTBODRAFT_29029 [Botryobasidium botryosum FD-172 SS1]
MEEGLEDTLKAPINPLPKPLPSPTKLTAGQERRLVDYVEEKLLEIHRGFKKRNMPSSTVPTLSSFLTALHPIFSLILLIPPVDPSSTLRTTLLLRLTGYVLDCIPAYALVPDTAHSLDDILVHVLDWLTELDQAWVAVLAGQQWDPVSHVGLDVAAPGRVPSQTDRTRLNSMVVNGKDALDDWLGEAGLDVDVREGFSGTFWRTLGALAPSKVDVDASMAMQNSCNI